MSVDYSIIQTPCFVCEIEDSLGEERGTHSHPINCGWRVKRERSGYIKGLEDIINLCDIPADADPKEVIEKIKNAAVSAYAGRYDIKW